MGLLIMNFKGGHALPLDGGWLLPPEVSPCTAYMKEEEMRNHSTALERLASSYTSMKCIRRAKYSQIYQSGKSFHQRWIDLKEQEQTQGDTNGIPFSRETSEVEKKYFPLILVIVLNVSFANLHFHLHKHPSMFINIHLYQYFLITACCTIIYRVATKYLYKLVRSYQCTVIFNPSASLLYSLVSFILMPPHNKYKIIKRSQDFMQRPFCRRRIT